MMLQVKNWNEFQQYKDRRPHWVKLHRELLNDRKFMTMTMASRAILPMIWLLASESEGGTVSGDPEELIFRLRISEDELLPSLKELIDNDFLIPDDEFNEWFCTVPYASVRKSTKPGSREREREEKRREEKRHTGHSALDVGFAKFWDLYPRKVGKAAAKKAWGKLKPGSDLVDSICSHLQARIGKDRQWNRGFVPNPATFLNQGRFEDDWETDSGLSDAGHATAKAASAWLEEDQHGRH